jgi:hypothetical protein
MTRKHHTTLDIATNLDEKITKLITRQENFQASMLAHEKAVSQLRFDVKHTINSLEK